MEIKLDIEQEIKKALTPIIQEIRKIKIEKEDEELLKDEDVAKILKIGKSTVYLRLKEDKNFPKPVKIGNATRWRKSQILAYIKSL